MLPQDRLTKPKTIGEAKKLGVTHARITCRNMRCSHAVSDIPIERLPFPDSMSWTDVSMQPRFRCAGCGGKLVYANPVVP